MIDYSSFVGAVVALGLGIVLYRRAKRSKVHKSNEPELLFQDLLPLFSSPNIQPGKTIGSWQLSGLYEGQNFQVQTIVDTLATRKLPSLWMMITLPEPQPLSGTLDLMMRPSGPTTFSNFDFLSHTLPCPDSFPDDAVIRTDLPDMVRHIDFMRPHLDIYRERHGKEFLLSPKGLRIVALAAQADHARYGVLRQASFGEHILDAEMAKRGMDILRAVHQQLRSGNA